MNVPKQPPQQNPNYQPPAQAYQPQPQWEQPQNIPNAGGQGPIPNPYTAPEQTPPMEIRPPESQTISFIPDAKTKEIIDQTSPEMSNAMINLAIKQFAERSEYVNYFVKEEYKQVAEQHTVEKKEEKKETPAVQEAAAGFSTW